MSENLGKILEKISKRERGINVNMNELVKEIENLNNFEREQNIRLKLNNSRTSSTATMNLIQPLRSIKTNIRRLPRNSNMSQ